MFTFYATIDADSVSSTLHRYIPSTVPLLLPASSWARYGLKKPNLPSQVTETAADCGGFVAARRWGEYRYSPAQYVGWLETFRPAWAAMFDWCCEDELTAGQPGLVRERQQRTTAMAEYFWQTWPDTPWAWCPTVQGWTIEDYAQHADELAPLIHQMHQAYGPVRAFRVGIGTLCHRLKWAEIHRVVRVVAERLPGVPLHLWGVKLDVLRAPEALPSQVVSSDSAAWNGLWASDIQPWRQSGLTQRQYTYSVALPRYLQKVAQAVTTPRQMVLLSEGEGSPGMHLGRWDAPAQEETNAITD